MDKALMLMGQAESLYTVTWWHGDDVVTGVTRFWPLDTVAGQALIYTDQD